MKIMLVSVPPWGVDAPPIGLACIAGALKKEKHIVEGFDMNIRLFKDSSYELRKNWERGPMDFWRKRVLDNYKYFLDKYLNEILRQKTNIIGMSGCDESLAILEYLLLNLRKKGISSKIIIGGSISSKKEIRQILDKYVDYYVIGQGEECIKYIIDILENKSKLKSTDCFEISKDNPDSNSICIKKKSLTKEFITPDFSIVPLNLYRHKELPIFFSRGCIYRCSFCEDSPKLYPFMPRNPEDVVAEMETNMKKYNINIFVATDLLINGSIPFLNKFCDIIIKKNLHPFWSGQASIRKEMAPALLVKMRMAGCFLLTYGVESFSDKIRKGMRKGELVSTVENVIKDTKKAGIAVRINLIVGFPREDESDVDKTISALKRLARYIDNIGCLNVCHVFPNTPLYDEYNHFGIPKESRSAGYLFVGKNTNFRLRIKRFRKIYYECKKLNLEPLLTNASDFLDTKL